MTEYLKRALHGFLCFLMAFQQIYPSYAQVVSDPAAAVANQAGVTSAPNGVPLVNIVNPNAAGVSHNKFTDYNVDAQGLILNNNRNIGISVLGGVVNPNPNLTAQATTILNEVTSSNSSSLKGFTEVHGGAANVIVANPNGITCDGCGFLNTPTATLTTGVPTLDGGGALTNLSVNSGQVTIEGEGLETGNKAQILSRAVELNGEIHAGEIEIVTGRNDYDPDTGAVTPKADAGGKPAFAIDSSALGGMYAGKITLKGTESGVGFRLAGDMAASVSDLTLSADGTIALQGTSTAKRDVIASSTSENVEVEGDTYAENELSLEADNGTVSFDNGSTSGALNSVVLVGDTILLDNNAAVVAGLSAGGNVVQNGSFLAQAATTLRNTDSLIASGGTLDIEAPTIINDEGTFVSIGDMTLTGTGGAHATSIENISGLIETHTGDINILSATLSNRMKNYSSTSSNVFYQRYYLGGGSHPGCNSIPGAGITPEGCAYFPGVGVARVPHPYRDNYEAYYSSTGRGNGDGIYVDYRVSETIPDPANSSAGALISSGKDLIIDATTTLSNDKSNLSALRNTTLSGGLLNNLGALLTRTHSIRTNSNTPLRCYGGNCKWASSGDGTVVLESEIIDSVNAAIQAVGTIDLTFTTVNNNSDITDSMDVNNVNRQSYVTSVGYSEETPSGDLSVVQIGVLTPGASQFSKDPGHPNYVHERRFAFIDMSTYYGSDYFLANVADGYDPDELPRRLGDAYYDTHLIRTLIFKETGNRFLDDGFASDSEQMKALIDNALAQQADLELVPGVTLTAEQIAALNSDIIWYVEEEFEGETVLTPRLYIASANRTVLTPKGALIAANDINIDSNLMYNSGNIASRTNIDIAADDGFINESGEITAAGDINITSADGSIIHTTEVVRQQTKNGGFIDVTSRRGTIDAGGNVTMDAGENLQLLGSDTIAEGDVNLTAGGAALIGGVEKQLNRQDIYNANGTSAHTQTVASTHDGSTVQAGGELNVNAGTGANVQGSDLTSGADMNIQTTLGNVEIDRSVNTSQTIYDIEKSGFRDIVTQGYRESVSNDPSRLSAGGDVNIGTGLGDVRIIASEIDAGNDINLNAPAGKVELLAAVDREFEQESRNSESALWVKASDKGSEHETVRHTILTGEGDLNITAANGVTVQYRSTGDLDQDIAQLAQAPGLAWMAELKDDPNVNWQGIEEVHREWSETHEGLGGPAAAVIALAIAIATQQYQLGAALLEGTALATSATATAAAQAGISALASQAGVSLISNKGDLSAVFKEMASADTVRSLAAAMITAGLLEVAGGGQMINRPDNLTSPLAVMEHVKQELIGAGIRSGVSTIINGENFSDAFKGDLRFAAAAVFGAQFSQVIGGLIKKGEISKAQQLLAHSLVGCVGASMGGGNCGGAAVGAALGEAMSDLGYHGLGMDKDKAAILGRYAALASSLATADDALDVTTTNLAASNAIANNFLLPESIIKKGQELQECGDDASCQDKVNNYYNQLSEKADKLFRDAKKTCSETQNCRMLKTLHYDLRLELTEEGNEYFTKHKDEFILLPNEKAIWHTYAQDEKGNIVNIITEQVDNKKYIHPLLKYEVVVDAKGKIITDPINAGTYNFYNPSLKNVTDPLIANDVLHKEFDVYPYFDYGNTEDDKTTWQQRNLRALYWFNAK